MKKKIILGALSTLSIAAPIVVVVSCGDDITQAIPTSNYQEKTLEMFHVFLKEKTVDDKFTTESWLFLYKKGIYFFKKMRIFQNLKIRLIELKSLLKNITNPLQKALKK